MVLKTYYFGLSNDEREMFARRCGTTRGHLQNAAYGYRSISTELAVAIERESHGEVKRVDMFPDTYRDKWPELADPKTAPDSQPAALGEGA